MDRYERRDPDRHFFFAYPEDYADNEIGYDDDGKLLHRTRRAGQRIHRIEDRVRVRLPGLVPVEVNGDVAIGEVLLELGVGGPCGRRCPVNSRGGIVAALRGSR